MTASSVDLQNFSVKEVLRNDHEHKVLCLHLVHRSDASSNANANGDDHSSAKALLSNNSKDAVLIVHRTAFNSATIDALLGDQARVESMAENDVYFNCNIVLPPAFNALKSTLIYPATDKHIDKYREQKVEMVTESSIDYQNITLPYLEKGQFSLQWVFNILDGLAEQESVLLNDTDKETGFILLPDLKWDRSNVDALYYSAIVHKRGIKSLRDLTVDHLPLLQNIKTAGCKAIYDKYGLREQDLRIFFHYQPSYYHLHVHFVNLKAEPIGATSGLAHLLDDVVDNLRMCPTYYSNKTFHFTLKCSHPLVKLLRK